MMPSHDQVLRNQSVGSTWIAAASGPRLCTVIRINMSSGAAFAYAALHAAVYVLRLGDLPRILTEALEAGLITGWLAFAIFVPLALTSNNASMRWLGRSWKRLHRAVYAAAVLRQVPEGGTQLQKGSNVTFVLTAAPNDPGPEPTPIPQETPVVEPTPTPPAGETPAPPAVEGRTEDVVGRTQD